MEFGSTGSTEQLTKGGHRGGASRRRRGPNQPTTSGVGKKWDRELGSAGPSNRPDRRRKGPSGESPKKPPGGNGKLNNKRGGTADRRPSNEKPVAAKNPANRKWTKRGERAIVREECEADRKPKLQKRWEQTVGAVGTVDAPTTATTHKGPDGWG